MSLSSIGDNCYQNIGSINIDLIKKAADYWKSKLKEIKKGYPLLLENLKENNEESLMSDLNNLYSAYIETGYLLDQNSMELTHDSDLETIQKEQKKVPLDEEKSEEKNKKHFSYEEVGTLNNIINAQMSEIKELRDEFNKNEKLIFLNINKYL